jgi:hypothetical protein
MSIATPADIETSLLRPLLQREEEYAPALLERAEGILLARIHDLLDRAEHDTTFHDLVAATEAEAVARVLRNPEALRQEAEGNYSYTINYQVASGLLDILDEEWQRLGAVQVAGSIAPATDGYLRTRHIVDAFQRDLN